jgi:hypothetical protein
MNIEGLFVLNRLDGQGIERLYRATDDVTMATALLNTPPAMRDAILNKLAGVNPRAAEMLTEDMNYLTGRHSAEAGAAASLLTQYLEKAAPREVKDAAETLINEIDFQKYASFAWKRVTAAMDELVQKGEINMLPEAE